MKNLKQKNEFFDINFSGSVSSKYLIESAEIIINATPKPSYYTPKSVIDFINKDCIIANPPFDVKKQK